MGNIPVGKGGEECCTREFLSKILLEGGKPRHVSKCAGLGDRKRKKPCVVGCLLVKRGKNMLTM